MRPKQTLTIALGLTVLVILTARLNPVHSETKDGEIFLIPPPANFDGDDYADLAIGVPGEAIGSIQAAGAVNVLYGTSPGGLSTSGDQFWHQNSPDIVGTAEENDSFGAALAAGDFDGDGYTDLAIGIPDEDVGSAVDAGSVLILYGTDSGLSDSGDQGVNDYLFGDTPEAGDHLGYALAAGDFDGDGNDDLAIGVPDEDYDDYGDLLWNAGCVHILYGSSSAGLYSGVIQTWHQDLGGGSDSPDDDEQFGYALIAGDFDGDGRDDLAIGAPGEGVESPDDRAGSVTVLYGSASGLTVAHEWITQTPLLDQSEENDEFGSALAAGDFDGDGRDDLAIGVPGEDVDARDSAGAVNVMFGSPGGLVYSGDQFLHQNVSDAEDEVQAGDEFGSALTAGDFNGDGRDDLAVGIPFEDIVPDRNEGAVHVFYGSGSGLTTTEDWWFHQDSPDIENTAEPDDEFGSALAAGDFNGDGYADLAVGVPEEDFSSIENVGAVNVVYGSVDGLSGTDDEFWHQSLDIYDSVEANDNFGFALAAIPTVGQASAPGDGNVYLPLIMKNY
jgi:hypothetical protein